LPTRKEKAAIYATGKQRSKLKQRLFHLKLNDILVTTGMDGHFSTSFQNSHSDTCGTSKRRRLFYDLEARPIAGPLEELSLVFVCHPHH